MTFQKKIEQLKNLILSSLSPLINQDYVLLDLPYYSNIGDTLIWEGQESFLSESPYKCLYRASADTYIDRVLKNDTTILLQGGGNFGDLYPKHQKFRKKIISEFLNNKIIIFPVSVHYSNESQILNDSKVFAEHKDLTICVRDQRSYDILKKYFVNNILILPDMAFCIPRERLTKFEKQSTDKVLFLKRNDKELSKNSNSTQIVMKSHQYVDVKDWPTKQAGNWTHKIINRPIQPKTPFKAFADYYAYNIYRNYLLKKGVKFLSNYDYVYTTRLHGAILSILLHKPFTFFDNSYGKNKGFYDAWLSDVEEIKFIHDTN